MNAYQKENYEETEITKKEQLKLDYQKAVQNGYDYLIIIARDLLSDDKEIIINYYGQVPNKMKYYLDYYNNDLQLMRNTDISIYKWMFA